MRDNPQTSRTICRIGKLTLDPRNETLLHGSAPLPLGRRAVALLLRLVQTPGEIVSRDELYEAVWQGRIVDEGNLAAQISQLRRTLRDEAASGDGWIETLARRGYRFIGPVEWQTDPAPDGYAPHPITGRTFVSSTQGTISNIPIAVPAHFIGRAGALTALDEALSTVANRPVATALHGLRGVGKTIVAAAYAQRHEADFRATWWLRAETVPTLRADLAALAVRLHWAPPEAAEETACTAALDGLRHDGEGILLIYDNAIGATELRRYMPKSGAARIIITSNAPTWRAYATPLEIPLWPSPVGADYLVARTGRINERDAAQRLSETLDGLPLAHEQAASYIECLEIPIAEYLRRFEAAPGRLLDHGAHAPADYHDGMTVAKAFHLAIEQMSATYPAGEHLLLHAALLPPEPIPVFLFREGRAAFGEPLSSQFAEDGLDETLAALRGFSLIGREAIADERDPCTHTDCLRLHRLVRQVAADRMTSEAREKIRATLITALASVYPRAVYNTPATWPRARRLDALALPLVGFPAAIPQGVASSTCTLLDGLGSFRHGALANFTQARPLYEHGFALAEATLGPDHPQTAQLLNNFALLLQKHGDFAAARPLHTKALALREKALGPYHPDVAVSLNNVAQVLAADGELAAAKPLFERALDIRQRAFGKCHQQTAQAMNNLAWLLHKIGDLEASHALHERALHMRETCLTHDHPDVANSLNNLSIVLLDLGKPNEALGLCQRAVGIVEAALGPDHPDTAAIRAQLARIVLAQGAPEAALPLAERALAAQVAALASDSLAIRSTVAIAASCLEMMCRPDAAAALRQQHRLP